MDKPLLDRVSSDLNLYIGGLFTLRRKTAIQEAGITHVLSVLRQPLDDRLFDGFVHKVVEVDDVDDENLLEHLPACTQFIRDGLEAGGGVLVHCAMGKSRSATAVCAFLMQSYNMTPSDALSQLRMARPLCEPNDGFMAQLELWQSMGTPMDIEVVPAYQRWLYQREVALSRACGQAPDADKIRFEDEHHGKQQGDANSTDFELRCKKCRRPLATSRYLLPHTPKVRQQPQHSPAQPSPAAQCAHYFLDPLSWMRPELEQGKLEGRLECPKCRTNIGKYAWQGMQCSCGEWIVPGISLARGRTDLFKSRPGGVGVGAGVAIRSVPGAVVEPPSSGKESALTSTTSTAGDAADGRAFAPSRKPGTPGL